MKIKDIGPGTPLDPPMPREKESKALNYYEILFYVEFYISVNFTPALSIASSGIKYILKN